jgi:hypothetical protein
MELENFERVDAGNVSLVSQFAQRTSPRVDRTIIRLEPLWERIGEALEFPRFHERPMRFHPVLSLCFLTVKESYRRSRVL